MLGYIKDILFNPVPPKSDGPPNTRTDMQPHRNRPEVQTNILQDPLTHGLREAKRQETPAEREDKPPHTKQTELTENNRFEKAYTRRPLAQHRSHARGGQVRSRRRPGTRRRPAQGRPAAAQRRHAGRSTTARDPHIAGIPPPHKIPPHRYTRIHNGRGADKGAGGYPGHPGRPPETGEAGLT